MSERPNIVLCQCDQLRAFETGCYGNEVIRTPHIDRVAAEGVRFATAMTNFPVCMASRSVLLSGQYNRTCTGGVANIAWKGREGSFALPEYPFHGRPHLRQRTLPEALGDLGYYNAAIGKWHIHSWPCDIGFDYYLIPRVHHAHTAQPFCENGGPEFTPEGYSVDFEAGRVERFLADRRDREQPFFLYYNISPPHCPLADAPEKYLKMYAPEEIPIRPNVDLEAALDRQDYWFRVYRYDFRYYDLHLPYAEELPEGYDLRRLIAEYYGLTSWVDETVGRLLEALEQTGQVENTVVVFTSDHGDNLGSHGLVQKGGPTEESARVPLLVRYPGLGRQGVVLEEQVASLVDLAPTLLALAGGEALPHMQGVDLGPVLRGEAPATERPHAMVETAAGAAMRTPGHLYFLPWRDAPKGALAEAPQHFYDMAADPYQLQNLAGSGRQAEVAAALDRTLREWDARTPWMQGD